MRKESAHIQKSMERRCLFFVWNSTQTWNKEPLLLHKENTLQWTKSHPNPQPTGILRGEFFHKFSQQLENILKKFSPFWHFCGEANSISYFSKHKTWPLLSPQKRRGGEVHQGDKSLICFFREVVHPNRETSTLLLRKEDIRIKLMLVLSRVSLGWNHPTSGSATMWCLSIWCVSMSWMIPHVESKPEWI